MRMWWRAMPPDRRTVYPSKRACLSPRGCGGQCGDLSVPPENRFRGPRTRRSVAQHARLAACRRPSLHEVDSGSKWLWRRCLSRSGGLIRGAWSFAHSSAQHNRIARSVGRLESCGSPKKHECRRRSMNSARWQTSTESPDGRPIRTPPDATARMRWAAAMRHNETPEWGKLKKCDGAMGRAGDAALQSIPVHRRGASVAPSRAPALIMIPPRHAGRDSFRWAGARWCCSGRGAVWRMHLQVTGGSWRSRRAAPGLK
jgi:hypothetical protein